MTIGEQLAYAIEKLRYWSARVGGVARRWQTYWSDKVAKLKLLAIPAPTQNTAAPSAPVVGSTSVGGSQITVPLTTASTGPNGIDHYNAYRGASSGSEVFVEQFTSWPYLTAPLAAGTYYFKFTGVSPNGLESSLSNEVSGTIGGALAADTTAPLTPTQPSIASGGGTTLPSVAQATPTADSTVNSGTQVVSGARHGKFYKDSVYQSGYDALVPTISSSTLLQIGTNMGTSGTDNGTTSTSPIVTGGVDSHYGTACGGLNYTAETATGKFTRVTQFNSSTGAEYWNKGVVDGFRASSASNDVYVDFIGFTTTGANVVRVEGRSAQGASAAALSSDVSLTYPYLVRKSYNPYTGEVLIEYSQNVGSPSYTTLYSGTVPGLGKTYLVGRGSAGSSVAAAHTYSIISSTLDSDVYFPFTGSRQIGSTTSVNIQYSQVDNAGRESALSTARTWTYDALDNGGGASGTRSYGGGYYIGGNGMNHNTARAIRLYAQERRTIISYINNWEATYGVTMASVFAAILAKNSAWKGISYLDSTRTQTTNFRNAVNSFQFTTPYGSGWLLLNGDGSVATWGDNFGNDNVENMAATALDNSGRSIQQFDPIYRRDCFRVGGGLSSIGGTANTYCVATYWDDFFGGPWIAGLFTVGNSGASAAMQAGFIAMFNNWRALMASDGVTGESWANISQCLQNMTPSAIAAYARCLDGGLCENIGSAIESTWSGSSGLIALWQANQQSVVTTNGNVIFQYLCSPTADSTEWRRRRVCTGFSQIFGNSLINLQYDPITYYVAADQLPVRMQVFDVNSGNGHGNSDPYGTDYLILGWVGNPVSGSAGAVQTSPYSGSYVYRREYDNAVYVACAPEAPGVQTFTLPYNSALPLCTDDTTYTGQTFSSGQTISISPGDSYVLRKT